MTAEQRIAAVVRQVCALAAIIFGALSQAVSGLHLPPAVGTALVVAGGVVVAVEHYVSDPSTGTTVAPPVTTPATPATAPPAPPAPPAPVVAHGTSS